MREVLTSWLIIICLSFFWKKSVEALRKNGDEVIELKFPNLKKMTECYTCNNI